jgi:hypothetical protein
MSKPILLGLANGRTLELPGTASGQVATWSETAGEWFAGPGVGGSGGGGEVFYFDFGNTTGISPVPGLPALTTSTPSTNPSLLGTGYDIGSSSVESADLTNGRYIRVAGFVTIPTVPGVLALPAGLWDFNLWLSATSNGPTQVQIQTRVFIVNAAGTDYGNSSGGGGNNQLPVASSDAVYVYDQNVPAQYILNVTMPQTAILATDRIYIELWAQKNTSAANVRLTAYFDSARPSHVHTTILVPVNLATDVTGVLPLANGGTGRTALASGSLLYGPASGTAMSALAIGSTGQVLTVSGGVPTWSAAPVTSAATPLQVSGGSVQFSQQAANLVLAGPTTGVSASPTFRSLVAADLPSLSGTYLPLAGGTMSGKLNTVASATSGAGLLLAPGAAPTTPVSGDVWATTSGLFAYLGTTTYQFAPLASPTFTGIPNAPTAPAGTSTTQLATTSFVTTAVANAKGVPYDVSGEVGGTPATSTEVFHFKSVRAWTLAASGHAGGVVTAPSATTTFDIYKNTTGTVLGTISISTGGVMTISISASGATLSFAVGDVMFIKTQANVNAVFSPFWTFVGTVA